MRRPQLSRKTLLTAGAAAALVFVSLLLFDILLLPAILKRGIQRSLRTYFQSDVQIDGLQIATFPHVRATASGIVLRFKGRTDTPPLIAIQKFSLTAGFLNLLRGHISSADIEGLQIHVPPQPPETSPGSPRRRFHWIEFPLVIDRVNAQNALLETLPGDPKHVPRDFRIQGLVIRSLSFSNSAPFHVTLTNPIPFGQIDSEGRFGPWQPDDPGETPVSGTFQYSHVDFNSIRGLSGTMSSSGRYSGTLDKIGVEGDTAMPDFSLDIAGNPMPLKTHYQAVVDGTNGNTYLTSVDAVLGDSPLHVSGEIVGISGVKGRHIMLDASAHGARARDVVGLAVRGGSPLHGAIDFQAKIDIPPGPKGVDIVDRLGISGQADMTGMRFTKDQIEGKLDSLSRAGQGKPKDQDIQDVAGTLTCTFATNHGSTNLSEIKFGVPGASVQLRGSYNMKTEALDFRGHVDLDAKLSRATTGVKAFFLRLADPFFGTAGGGSSVPIKITGTFHKPHFGLALGEKGEASAQSN